MRFLWTIGIKPFFFRENDDSSWPEKASWGGRVYYIDPKQNFGSSHDDDFGEIEAFTHQTDTRILKLSLR